MDFGGKTCGVALSDPLMITAQPLEIIRRDRENKLRRTLARIEELIIEYEVGLIILGLMSDERLTTVEAEEIMKKQGIPRDKFHDYVDMIAAGIILSDYLENHREQLREGLSRFEWEEE